jgi:hypothetical protein
MPPKYTQNFAAFPGVPVLESRPERTSPFPPFLLLNVLEVSLIFLILTYNAG